MKRKAAEDKVLVSRRTEETLKRLQEELDADPELKKKYNKLMDDW